MKYIVSTEDFKLRGYIVAKSLKDVDISACECLVFNDSIDDSVDDILILSKLRGKEIKCIYIAAEIDPLYSIAFNALDGLIVHYNEPESLLHDKEVLDYMVQNYKTSNMGIKSASQEFESLVECIKELCDTTDRKDVATLVDSTVNNNLWKKNLQVKIASVDAAVALSEVKDDVTLKLIKKLGGMLDEVTQSNAETTYSLGELQKTLAEMQVSSKQNTITCYTKYTVNPANKHVLYVKEYSTCPFLKSFMCAYIRHIKRAKELNFKMLLILPKLKNVMEKYSEMPRLSPDSIKLVNIDDSDKESVFITYEPTKAVMDKLFNSKYDGYIIVDCTFGADLIAGPTVTKLMAVSSCKEMIKLKVPENKTIMAMIDTGKNIGIPYFEEYASHKNDTAKISMYVTNCEHQYEKIDKMLNLMQE